MATRSDSIVIFDSSSLVSLIREDDALHERARDIKGLIADKGLHLILPHEVFVETLNVMGKKHGKQVAVETAEILLAGDGLGDLELVASTQDTLRLATKFQATATGSPSFVDCLVMAVADQHATSLIFGFDDAFRKNGYRLPGNKDAKPYG